MAMATVGRMPYPEVGCTLQPYLLLGRSDRVDVPGSPAPTQLIQAQGDGGNRHPIIQGLAGRVAAGQGQETAPERDQISHADQGLDLRRRKTDVHEELLERNGLLPLRGIREVRRHAHHQTVELALAVDDDLLAQEHPRVESADLGDAEEPLLDLADHEGDLVHVAGEHDRRTGLRAFPPAQGDEVPHRVHAHLIGALAEGAPHAVAYLGLVPRRAARLGELPQETGGFHGQKIPAAAA